MNERSLREAHDILAVRFLIHYLHGITSLPPLVALIQNVGFLIASEIIFLPLPPSLNDFVYFLWLLFVAQSRPEHCRGFPFASAFDCLEILLLPVVKK